MTNENRRSNIADEVARAAQALEAGRALIGLGLFSDAMSRAYYAAFHMLRAALLSRGVDPKTHVGTLHLYNTELVRAGHAPSGHNRALASLQRSRELADYDAAITFTAADANAALADATEVSETIRALLVKEGWLVEVVSR